MKKPTVHFINPMENPYGGSEARVLMMAKALSGMANVKVWSEYDLANEFKNGKLARPLRPRMLQFPLSGIFVFVGTYFWIGEWMRIARPKRILVISNIPGDYQLKWFMARVAVLGHRCPVNIAYASPEMSKRGGLPGPVLLSPIDVVGLQTCKEKFERKSKHFVIGRLSRDEPLKHHPDDISLYKALAARGYKIRLMGAECLLPSLSEIENVEILPCGAESVEQFLATLDCFYYRTSPEWFEPHGRVITEAMAAGVPVVAGEAGGYANYLVRHGETGFLISSNEAAIECIERLHLDSSAAILMKQNAQSLVKQLADDDLNQMRSLVIEGGENIRHLINSKMAD